MKKYLYYILFLSVCHGYSQYNENAPWMNMSQKKSSINSKTKLSDLSVAFNQYWKNKDSQKKGSGFKPFKRWENHWKNHHHLHNDNHHYSNR